MSNKTKETKPFVVVFAGVPGTSKTPISNYLSCEFSLPIFSTDQIRYEVLEDLQVNDINLPQALSEFEKRRNARFEKLLAQRKSFILDGSMDRRWREIKKRLEDESYLWFMINMELSKDFLIKFYDNTHRSEWASHHLDDYLAQHNDFLSKYQPDINLEITDKTFADRLITATEALKNFTVE